MHNYALKTDGRALAAVEEQLRKYLPGLDVHLWPLSATQAVIRAPLVRALEIDYPAIGAGPLLKVLGITSIRAIGDAETVTLLAGRDIDAIAPRQSAAIPQVAGMDWHLDMVRAPAAWALVGGPDHIAWGDVSVGHTDTGYTHHPALGLGATTWVDVARGQTMMPAAAAGEGSMFAGEPGGGVDNLEGLSAGHGTRIAGTICGHAPGAAGGAFYGVAPRLPLLPLRITDAVWINHAQREFAQALDFAIDNVGVKVINVSLGVFAGVVIGAMRDAINKAYQNGVIVVCAAGNYVNDVVAPARLRRTVAVAGVTRDSQPWGGSSCGAEVDFSAPAADVRRASVTKNSTFEYTAGGDGTSYATAITTGAAALWLVHRRAEIAATYPQPWQRVAAFTAIARSTTTVPAGWQQGSFGTGILNIEALLEAPLPRVVDLVLEDPV